MNNRPGSSNFNQGMDMFNNLMGTFSNTMNGMGNQSASNMQNIGERLGSWGQQMGTWGQSMANLVGDRPSPNSNFQPPNPNYYSYQSNLEPNSNMQYQSFTTGPNQQQTYNQPNFSSHPGNSQFNFNHQDQQDYGNTSPFYGTDGRPQNRGSQQNFRADHRYPNSNRHNVHNDQQNHLRSNKRVRTEQMTPEKKLLNDAKAFIKKDEYDNAIDSLLHALEINPESHYNQLLAYCYLKKGDYSLAIVLLKGLIEKDPENSKLNRYIGIAYLEKAKQTSSMDFINRGIEHLFNAFELAASELNNRNYLNAKKLRFLAMNESEFMRKTDFIEKIKKYNIESIENFMKKNRMEKQQRLPEHFKCAITLDLMQEPYQTPSGISYEKEALKSYVEKTEPKDPITSDPFRSFDDCIPNNALKDSVKLSVKKNPALFEFYESSADWRDIKFEE